MKAKLFLMLLFVSLLVVILVVPSGCSPDPEEKPVGNEEPVEEEAPPEKEPPVMAATYFWPWLSHSRLVLSSGEVIDGPNLFESDTGFVAEFTEDYYYSGRVVWLVDKTDVFKLEWITLTFDVDFFDLHEWEHDFAFQFNVEDINVRPGDEGTREIALNLVEEQHGFKVTLDSLILGKKQESDFATEPLDYVALVISLSVVDMP